MHESVAYRSFVDITRLRVGYLERVITAMLVFLISQRGMQFKKMLLQRGIEFLHIRFLALAALELFPCTE